MEYNNNFFITFLTKHALFNHTQVVQTKSGHLLTQVSQIPLSRKLGLPSSETESPQVVTFMTF
jgi:hypothetical protein